MTGMNSEKFALKARYFKLISLPYDSALSPPVLGRFDLPVALYEGEVLSFE